MFNLPQTSLFVENIHDNEFAQNSEWTVVYATQTIHYQYLDWNRTTDKPNKNHLTYNNYIDGNYISLNWVNSPAYLYNCSGADTLVKILDFIENWIEERIVIVHCDKGLSRSPSVCLLYLSKRMGGISNESYSKAEHEYEKMYPGYNTVDIEDYINDILDNIK